ncbi:MAG: hypothetical protein COB98_02125 [Flavobacteriaceae bacterium]|nr:MAG: hypothetical protein COB98_02125 [Flavobacteriaceae bacterium]
MTELTIILLQMLVAHVLGDFLLQPSTWVKDKEKNKIRSKFLYLHVLLHGVLVYVFIGQWNQVFVPLFLMCIHFLIDVTKLYQKKSTRWFIIDQIAHVCSIVIIWLVFYHQFQAVQTLLLGLFKSVKFWKLALGYAFILQPVSILMYQLTRNWHQEIDEKKDASLKNAGKWIGMLERILILTFIVIGQFTAIGFLLAAKSIFRFGDLTQKKDRKLTEYILIGTLLSFTITILVGLLVTL